MRGVNVRDEMAKALSNWAAEEGFPGLSYGPYADAIIAAGVVKRAEKHAAADELERCAAEVREHHGTASSVAKRFEAAAIALRAEANP